mgnify:CR=1 FL=1
MNAIYRSNGITKQSFHQHLERMLIQMEEQQQLLPVISQLREDHPRMSVREMYRLIRPEHIGRDRFIEFCFNHGYQVEVKRSFHRTTNGTGVIRFDNLIVNREFTGVNQVWVSDITYYRIGDKFDYLTFIMDLYSRLIVGYSVSDNLRTESTTLPALEMALKERNPEKGLILHSDGGGQYYCKVFTALTHHSKIKNSMCESVYENPHAERVNGTIKNDYVIPYGPQDFNQLKKMVTKAINMYNKQRPHQSLNGVSPAMFEKILREKEGINLNEVPPSSLFRSLRSLHKEDGGGNNSIKKLNNKQQKTVNVC